jgi:hypothetical protein
VAGSLWLQQLVTATPACEALTGGAPPATVVGRCTYMQRALIELQQACAMGMTQFSSRQGFVLRGTV